MTLIIMTLQYGTQQINDIEHNDTLENETQQSKHYDITEWHYSAE